MRARSSAAGPGGRFAATSCRRRRGPGSWYIVLAGTLACGNAPPHFECHSDASCQAEAAAGWCEPNGFCSFTDHACDTARRYGELAPEDIAGECVSAPSRSETTAPKLSAGETDADTGGDTTGALDPSATNGSGSWGDDTQEGNTGARPDCFQDEDNDGHGVGNTVECGPDTASRDGDCDDADARVFPGGLGCPGPDSLVAWWRFDEFRGSRTEVPSEQGHAAMLFGDVRTTSDGAYGGALDLTELNALLDLTDAVASLAPNFVAPQGTVELWLRMPPDFAQSCAPVCNGVALHISDGFGDGFGSRPELNLGVARQDGVMVAQGYVQAVADEPSCELTPPFSDDVVLKEGWNHIGLSWGQGACRLYVNGSIAKTDTLGPVASPWLSARVGQTHNNGPSRAFTGAIDEVMLFDAIRSPSEVVADCGSPCAPP